MFAAAAKRTALAAVSIALLVAVSFAGVAGGGPKRLNRDRVPPSPPTNIHVETVTSSNVFLRWDASQDDVGVAGYYVYGDTGKATAAGPSYNVTSLRCGESTAIAVAAFDSAGNRSSRTFTTVATAACPDRQPPSIPSGFVQRATTQNAVVLAWSPSVDDVGVVAYGVHRDLARIASPAEPVVALSGLRCGSSVRYDVDAVDAAGNRSRLATTFVRTASCGDDQAPTAPSNLTVTERAATVLGLSWSASTDDVGVAGYGVSVDGRPATSVPETKARLSGVACGKTYAVGVNAFDVAGNTSPAATINASTSACVSPPGDTTPPSTPNGLAASDIAQTGLTLGWNASTDDVGVTGYDVFRNDAKVATVSSTQSIQSLLTCATAYTFGVAARDAAGNSSPRAEVTVSTASCISPPGDTTPPSVPTGLGASGITQTGLKLGWNASTDNVAVTGYDVFRNDAKLATVTSTESALTGLTCATAYNLAVAAHDAAGNSSAKAGLTVATAACSSPPGDTTPPTQPGSLAISNSTRDSVSLTWAASTDNVGVTGYRTYVDGAASVPTTSPGATITGLTCGTSHTFAVEALDAAGNRSTRATVGGATAACADTQKPTVPTGVVATSRTATSIALQWSASSDNVGVTGYGLYRGGTRIGTSSGTTGIFSSLQCNTNYTLGVDAYDAADNHSNQAVVMVSTTACPDTAPPSMPTGFAASSITQTSLNLGWNASSDNVGVTGYDVYRDGTKMATVTGTSAPQTGLACGTAFTFGVRALDAAGNASGQAALNASTTACSPPPPPPSSGHLTGTHWPENNEFGTLKQIGYGFAVSNVAPGDINGARAKLDAARAAGIKLIIGLYSFGGPEPYSMSNGQWTLSQGAIDSINYLESRSSDIVAFFGFNEPYWLNQFTGQGDPCGAHSAASLRDFRNKIRAVWPDAKIYHDIGHAAAWAPGGYLYNAHSCIGQKYADATGVADYVGVYEYPFQSGGYMKAQGLATLARETSYVKDKMNATPVWLGQAHSGVEGMFWPSLAQLQDWNCSVRAALPAGSLISWYVWRQEIYGDYLVRHPEAWSRTTAAVC